MEKRKVLIEPCIVTNANEYNGIINKPRSIGLFIEGAEREGYDEDILHLGFDRELAGFLDEHKIHPFYVDIGHAKLPRGSCEQIPCLVAYSKGEKLANYNGVLNAKSLIDCLKKCFGLKRSFVIQGIEKFCEVPETEKEFERMTEGTERSLVFYMGNFRPCRRFVEELFGNGLEDELGKLVGEGNLRLIYIDIDNPEFMDFVTNKEKIYSVPTTAIYYHGETNGRWTGKMEREEFIELVSGWVDNLKSSNVN